MGIQRFGHFVSNSMKTGALGIKTSLTTETEAFSRSRLFSAVGVAKMLATFRRGTAFVLAGAGLALPLRKGQEGGPLRPLGRGGQDVSKDEPGPGGHLDHGGRRLGRPDRGQLEDAIGRDGDDRRRRLVLHHAQDRQICRQDDRLAEGDRRQQICRQHHRPGERQDLFWQGDPYRHNAQDERLRARRPDLQEPDLAQALIANSRPSEAGPNGPVFFCSGSAPPDLHRHQAKPRRSI
ncbi:hypothetical protein MPLSOD_40895 [Mesorhizobium sp. SOD10]|nr:hypothetical protein MPLSOD_40895 [Mesorhizobium sp. SOD10]